MSSNSSGVSNQLIEEFGGSLFHWLSTNVLPFGLGSILALCVFVGIILNLILLVVYGKRKLHKDPTNDFIPQIAIVDLLASFLVVIPSSVAALLHEWPLSDTLCTLHGILVTWFHLLSFALIILIFVERVVKAWNPGLHGGTFNRHLFVVIISVFVWAGELLFSLLPIMGIGTIEFNEYQSQCSLVHQRHHILTHVLFSLGLYCSPLICLVCFILLVEKRRRAILHERQEERNKLIDLSDKKGGSGDPHGGEKWAEGSGKVPPDATKEGEGTGTGNALGVVKNGPSKAWDKSTENGKAPLFKKNANNPASGDKPRKSPLDKKMSRAEFLESYNRRMSRPQSQTLMKRMFRDSEDEKDHHQAMTALITWCLLEICWVWYLVAAMLEMYLGEDVWGGWHIIGVLMGDLTYCIKPIIYLAHNRHYRKASVETMPQSVRDTAGTMARKVSQAVEKMDNMLFISPATKKPKTQKLHVAIAVRLLAMRWKRKAGIGISKSGGADGKKPTRKYGAEKKTVPESGAAKAPKPSASLMGSAIAQAAMAQAAARNKESSSSGAKSADNKLLAIPEAPNNHPPPVTPSNHLSSRQGTPGSRPATKSSVMLSMQGGERSSLSGPISPRPLSTAASSAATTARVGDDDDLALLMNPYSPQV